MKAAHLNKLEKLARRMAAIEREFQALSEETRHFDYEHNGTPDAAQEEGEEYTKIWRGKPEPFNDGLRDCHRWFNNEVAVRWVKED